MINQIQNFNNLTAFKIQDMFLIFFFKERRDRKSSGVLTCSVGSRVWSDTGTLATRGMQMQLLQELGRRAEQSDET